MSTAHQFSIFLSDMGIWGKAAQYYLKNREETE